MVVHHTGLALTEENAHIPFGKSVVHGLMTIADTLTKRSECRMVTVSQRLTRSRSAEYSGCFQSGSKDTFTRWEWSLPADWL